MLILISAGVGFVVAMIIFLILLNRSEKFLKMVLKFPLCGKLLNKRINTEIKKTLLPLYEEMQQLRNQWQPIFTLPQQGLSANEILFRLRDVNINYHPARSSSTVYGEYEPELSQLLQEVWRLTALCNPLHSEWPLINFMEAEVLSMCAKLLNATTEVHGTITHGGSVSILEACKAYVLKARQQGNLHPEIIVPESIHVSFEKAAQILNVKLVKIPLTEKGLPCLDKLRKAINKQTCLLAASSPSFAFGLFDPIAEIGEIALQAKLPLHVDACLGGFLNVFAKEAGYFLPPSDFSVPGVSSISMGTHKYGQTPNGTSVVIFNTAVSPTHVHLDWMGGMYVSPGIEGTRSGAEIALAWTVLCYKGREHYIEMTRQILDLTQDLAMEVQKIEGLTVPFLPMLSIIVIYTQKNINPLIVANRLKMRGNWLVNVLQDSKHRISGFHFCLTPVHVNYPSFKAEFLSDLSEAVEYARQNPHDNLHGMFFAYTKLQKGVPHFIQQQMGERYIQLLNTL